MRTETSVFSYLSQCTHIHKMLIYLFFGGTIRKYATDIQVPLFTPYPEYSTEMCDSSQKKKSAKWLYPPYPHIVHTIDLVVQRLLVF